jgi:hypothetical protein
VKRAHPSLQHPPVNSHLPTTLAPAPGPTHLNWLELGISHDLLRIPGTFLFLPLPSSHRRLQLLLHLQLRAASCALSSTGTVAEAFEHPATLPILSLQLLRVLPSWLRLDFQTAVPANTGDPVLWIAATRGLIAPSDEEPLATAV